MSAVSASGCAARCPGVGVYLSSEVLPEIREFERASTTAVCASVGPLLAGYLDRLQRAVSALGLPQLYVMGSSGGVLDVAEALRMPAMVIESGPAAGVIAAALAGKELGLPNLISFDMGGTTAKASLIADGEIAVTAEYEVGGAGHAKRWLHGTGHPVRVPVDRPRRGQRRRRQHRLGRSGRRAQTRSAERRRRSWPGRLRQGRHRSRRSATPMSCSAGSIARRCSAVRCAIDAAAAEAAIRERVGDPLGTRPDRRRRRDRRDRQQQHGARHCASSRSSAATTRASSR